MNQVSVRDLKDWLMRVCVRVADVFIAPQQSWLRPLTPRHHADPVFTSRRPDLQHRYEDGTTAESECCCLLSCCEAAGASGVTLVIVVFLTLV